MTSDTRQLFSVGSDEYAASRPRYPQELYDYILRISPVRDRAWDCGTGSGQAAAALAEWFAEVEATDVSPQQIANARAHERVHYSVQAAEHSSFPDRHFSLVTVAQALHWFDFAAFWPEVHRVLQPGGVFAAWTYTLPHITPQLDRIIDAKLLGPIAPYWAPQNRLAWDAYVNVPFPFRELEVPQIDMRLCWTLGQFVAYLKTWSATRACIEAMGPAFFADFEAELAEAWGDPALARDVSMDFHCRIGRHEH
jgi:SAM-dependent methyltransferase